jgi:hypothetical protein
MQQQYALSCNANMQQQIGNKAAIAGMSPQATISHQRCIWQW